MRGMAGLAEVFTEMHRAEIKSKGKNESSLVQGVIRGSYVCIGSKSYPFTTAVDVNIIDGMYVWCEISNGLAVILGA